MWCVNHLHVLHASCTLSLASGPSPHSRTDFGLTEDMYSLNYFKRCSNETGKEEKSQSGGWHLKALRMEYKMRALMWCVNHLHVLHASCTLS